MGAAGTLQPGGVNTLCCLSSNCSLVPCIGGSQQGAGGAGWLFGTRSVAQGAEQGRGGCSMDGEEGGTNRKPPSTLCLDRF